MSSGTWGSSLRLRRLDVRPGLSVEPAVPQPPRAAMGTQRTPPVGPRAPCLADRRSSPSSSPSPSASLLRLPGDDSHFSSSAASSRLGFHHHPPPPSSFSDPG